MDRTELRGNDVPRVLFLCTGNSCRSQMAEGWLRHLAGDRVQVLSAGTTPVGVNPRAVRVMAEVGIDLSTHTSDAFESFRADPPELVIAVCDRAAEACRRSSAMGETLCWVFPDPAHAVGTEEEILAEFRAVRDAIRARIERWLAEGAVPIAI
jgi:arsenate reductase